MTTTDLQQLTNDSIRHNDIDTMFEMKETIQTTFMNDEDKKDLIDLINIKLEELGEL
jgi:hypothetical protein